MSTAAIKRRLRGVILKLVGQNQEKQKHRHDHATLTVVLDKLGFDVYENLVRELVQDLGAREALTFNELRDRKSGEVSLTKIQITPKGRNLLEGSERDPGIEVEVE